MDEETLVCHTAKGKLKEARYFLKQLSVHEIWNNDDLFDYNLNAFVYASDAIIDYVHADFMYHKIKDPRINWCDYQDKNKKKTIKASHPQKEAIERFLGKFGKELGDLYNDPLVNYFKHKRNKITHIQWDGSKSASFTQESESSPRVITERKLEPSYIALMANDHSDYNLDLFESDITRDVQLSTLTRLVDESAMDLLNEYLTKMENFITKFDGVNFYKKLR